MDDDTITVTVTQGSKTLKEIEVPREALDTRWNADLVAPALRAALVLLRAGLT